MVWIPSGSETTEAGAYGRSDRGASAVQRYARAVDVLRVVAREKGHRGRDLGGIPGAAGWRLRYLQFDVLRVGRCHRGQRRPGAHRVDPYSAGPEFGCPTAGQQLQRGLGRAVQAGRGGPEQRGLATEIDDHTFATTGHGRGDGRGEEVRRLDVDRVDPVEVRLRHGVGRAADSDAGVVDQDVGPAVENPGCLNREFARAARIGQVRRDEVGLAAGLNDGFDDFVATRLVPP